jgi:hypothetical protein
VLLYGCKHVRLDRTATHKTLQQSSGAVERIVLARWGMYRCDWALRIAHSRLCMLEVLNVVTDSSNWGGPGGAVAEAPCVAGLGECGCNAVKVAAHGGCLPVGEAGLGLGLQSLQMCFAWGFFRCRRQQMQELVHSLLSYIGSTAAFLCLRCSSFVVDSGGPTAAVAEATGGGGLGKRRCEAVEVAAHGGCQFEKMAFALGLGVCRESDDRNVGPGFDSMQSRQRMQELVASMHPSVIKRSLFFRTASSSPNDPGNAGMSVNACKYNLSYYLWQNL